MTRRQVLISRLTAALRGRLKSSPLPVREFVYKAVEEHLSEVKASGDLYDALPETRGKFDRIVREVVVRLCEDLRIRF